MTTGMIMVQWADLTGRGFSPHEVGPAAPREYWAAAERLLQADLSQPPEGIRSTVGHPIWTLRRVQVQGRWLWCFVVQGRRGPFGVAGTCRFAFATEDMSALQAWTAGGEIAAGDQGLPPVPHDAGWFEHTVMQVLGGIVVRQGAVPVSGGPAEAAALIPAALKVLPERQSRAWSWSTCMLQRPDSPDLRVVSGAWPDEFRRSEPNRAESIDHWFRRGPVTEEEIKARLARDDVRRGFEYLVHYASTGKRPEPELLRGEYSLDEMLIELGHANHVPDWPDVPSMLETPGGVRRLSANHRPLVQQWAEHEPAAAIGRLRADFTAPLAEDVLMGAVRAQNETPENLLGLPTAEAPELTDWHDHLAALLQSCYRQRAALREHTRHWITPGAVLGNDRDLAAARDWLLKLGLTPQDDPEHFPPSQDIVIGELNHHHDYTEVADGEMALARRPLALLDSLVTELQPLPADAVATLLWMSAARYPGRPPDSEARLLQPLAATLTRSGLRGKADEGWVDDLLRTIQEEPSARRSTRLKRIMWGALEALLELDPHAPRHRPLTERCLGIGYDNAPHHIAAALRLAKSRLAAAAEQQRRLRLPDGEEAGRTHTTRPGWRRWYDRCVHEQILTWRQVFLVGAGLAVAALAASAAVIAVRVEPAPPPPRKQPQAAAAPATAETPVGQTGPGGPPPHASPDQVRIVLPPPRNDGPDDDERQFQDQFNAKVLPIGNPKAIEIIAYGTDQERAKRLERMLRESYPERLDSVSFSSWATNQKPPAGVLAGSLVGNVYFRN
ncbi:hypothetical protein [Actinoplanes sp. NPDC049118]|uniref:hypothetical protein n=1 Tax=Actinoplanes sp. NPDC049118 TaxID=3155769 RepID=UPI0033C32ED3